MIRRCRDGDGRELAVRRRAADVRAYGAGSGTAGRAETARRAFIDGIADSTARAILKRLDRDTALQARVHRFHQDVLLAGAKKKESLAMEAFGARQDACDDCERGNRSYGQQMHWSSPPTIFVPATDTEAAAGVRQGGIELPPLPADVSGELARAGFEDVGMGDLPGFAQDAVTLHEIGHLLTRAFGIATPTLWLNEFLANYWWSAYWREDLPAFTRMRARMMAAAPAAPAGTRPSLDFERGEPGGWQNYVWYQGRIGERVDAVLDQRGIAFLTDVRNVLPRDCTGPLGTEAVVERLETISTGWREWIASFRRE